MHAKAKGKGIDHDAHLELAAGRNLRMDGSGYKTKLQARCAIGPAADTDKETVDDTRNASVRQQKIALRCACVGRVCGGFFQNRRRGSFDGVEGRTRGGKLVVFTYNYEASYVNKASV